jgi:hypothetical protein
MLTYGPFPTMQREKKMKKYTISKDNLSIYTGYQYRFDL